MSWCRVDFEYLTTIPKYCYSVILILICYIDTFCSVDTGPGQEVTDDAQGRYSYLTTILWHIFVCKLCNNTILKVQCNEMYRIQNSFCILIYELLSVNNRVVFIMSRVSRESWVMSRPSVSRPSVSRPSVSRPFVSHPFVNPPIINSCIPLMTVT